MVDYSENLHTCAMCGRTTYEEISERDCDISRKYEEWCDHCVKGKCELCGQETGNGEYCTSCTAQMGRRWEKMARE